MPNGSVTQFGGFLINGSAGVVFEAGSAIYYTTNGSTPTTSSALYSGAIPMSSTTMVQAIATATSYRQSEVGSALYSIAPATSVANPVFNSPPGTYVGSQNIAIISATGGASIRYTLDGSTPSSTHGTPINNGASVTLTASASAWSLNAIAYATGMSDSSVVSGTYTVGALGPIPSVARDYIRLGSQIVAVETLPSVAIPTFTPTAGSYSSTQNVTMATATQGASIRYTTNGSNPSETNGALYAGQPVAVSSNTTLKAIAYGSGLTDSPIASGVYTINAVATPLISPNGGTFTTQQQVSITTATQGVTIRVTEDGSTPSETNGVVYTSPFQLASSTTVMAIAYATGSMDSSVASATFNFITVSITGPSLPLEIVPGGTTQFTAAVNGAPNQSVAWSAMYGTITAAGVYTAPASVPQDNGIDYITATSSAYPSVSMTVEISVVPTVVTVAPNYTSGVYLVAGQEQQFSAAVTPDQNQAVTWSVSPLGYPVPPWGTITTSGLFIAPSSGFSSTISNLVTAASQANSTANGNVGVGIDPVATPRVLSTSPINGSNQSVTFSIGLTGGSYPVSVMYLFLNTALTSGTGAGCLIQVNSNNTYAWGFDNYSNLNDYNSNCNVTAASFNAGSNNGATVTVTISFLSPWFNTTQDVYVTVGNSNGQDDPASYQTMGTWEIP